MFLHLSVILFTGGGGRGISGRGHTWWGCMAGGACMVGACVCVERGVGECAWQEGMATEAGGTHPTGMQSCFSQEFTSTGCTIVRN